MNAPAERLKCSNPLCKYVAARTQKRWGVSTAKHATWSTCTSAANVETLKHGGLCEKAEGSEEPPRAPVHPKEPMTQDQELLKKNGKSVEKCWS